MPVSSSAHTGSQAHFRSMGCAKTIYVRFQGGESGPTTFGAMPPDQPPPTIAAEARSRVGPQRQGVHGVSNRSTDLRIAFRFALSAAGQTEPAPT